MRMYQEKEASPAARAINFALTASIVIETFQFHISKLNKTWLLCRKKRLKASIPYDIGNVI